MTKEQKIKEAFGKSWDKLSYSMHEHILKVHHWVDRSQNRMNLSPKDLGFDEQTECEVHCEFWRPIQLKGIENNNGWIKIESESDLPKDDKGETLYNSGKILRNGKFEQRAKRASVSYLNYFFKNGMITHYQPIIKPEPPIY